MNNEPVAWMDKNGVPSTVKSDLYNIPLIKLKTLTDQEIHKVFRDTWDSTTNPNCIFTAFARAILRKAQEK